MYPRKLSSRFTLRLIGFLALGYITIEGQAQSIQAVSVCQVFLSPGASTESYVAVRGELEYSREYFSIVDRSCDFSLSTGSHKWPTAVSLIFRTKVDSIEWADENSVRFVSDFVALLLDFYRRSDPPSQIPLKVSATFVGKLNRLDPQGLLKVLDSGMTTHKPGFGHLGGYLAEIEVVAIRDLTINGFHGNLPLSEPTEPKSQ